MSRADCGCRSYSRVQEDECLMIEAVELIRAMKKCLEREGYGPIPQLAEAFLAKVDE